MKEAKSFSVTGKKKFKLTDFPTVPAGDLQKEDGELMLTAVKARMSVLQEKLYASHSNGLLIILQAMDAGGKDSLVQHVFSGLNPQGCAVHSFKTPSSEENSHDFLWRHAVSVPARGMIGIHNRSYYESVLIAKVHPEFIVGEGLPGYGSVDAIGDKFWKKRYQSIRNYEAHLKNNGITVLKFFLHISMEEQRNRLLERLDDKEKNWKFLSQDVEERTLWPKYMEAYEEAIAATTTKTSPWYVIPADKKWYARLKVAELVEMHLNTMKLNFPGFTDSEAKIAEARKQLTAGN